METKRAKPKKNSFPPGKSVLPLKRANEIVGFFNGHFVIVPDLDSMTYLYEAGNFGKGSLSKGEPRYNVKKDDVPKIVLQHQFDNQTKWNSSTGFHPTVFRGSVKNDHKLSLQSVSSFLLSCFGSTEQESWKSWKEKNKQEYLRVNYKNDSAKMNTFLEHMTDESDYKDENFINIVNEILELRQIRKPSTVTTENEEVILLNTAFNPCESDFSVINTNAKCEKLPFMITENLNLNLEESFFLKSVLGCLKIMDLNFTEISISDLWDKFNSVNKNFFERYITYHYYRTKGWVVRSGLKFGGDYLLYKNGPAYYHASYLVKVLDRRKRLTWREFVSMNRLVETFNKDLLLTNIVPKHSVDQKCFPDVLNNNSVQEVLVRRWFPSKERILKTNEVLS